MTGPAVGLVPLLAFADPERLLILLVIPLMVAAYVFAMRRKNRRGMRFTNTSMLEVVVPKQSQWRRHVAVALSLLSLITLTAAFARPKTQVDVVTLAREPVGDVAADETRCAGCRPSRSRGWWTPTPAGWWPRSR